MKPLSSLLLVSLFFSQQASFAGQSSGGGGGTYGTMSDDTIAAADVLLNNPDAVGVARFYGDHFCGGYVTTGTQPSQSLTVISYSFQICQTLPNGTLENAATLVVMDSQTAEIDKVIHSYKFYVQKQF